jgi:uncharacterized membrane protein
MDETLKTILTMTIPAAVPTLAVMIAVLLNRNDANQIRNDMSQIRNEMSQIRNDMSKMRDLFHSDIMHLLEHDRDQDSRITRIEERAK